MALPLAVAVTGGIGAGKSEALAAFSRRGVPTLSSDLVVHRLIESDPEVREALEGRFATTDRSRIAEIVFADRDELAWLEALLHPRVQREYAVWLEQQEGEPVVAVEIPLLFETGAEARFDAVVVITAPEPVRAARARVPVVERSGRLISDDQKMQRADFAFVNDGSLEELDAFVARVLGDLRGRS